MNQGLTFFLIGLFKKLVLADNFAIAADTVFKACEGGATVTFIEGWVGALAYTLQLYFDFSGYSEMAIGLGLMFGVRFPLNFYSPYKATSLIEFWRRWHMTMTRFFQTYVYTPVSMAIARRFRWVGMRYLSILFLMLVIGLWHGAGWTWILWGLMHGVLLIGNHLFRAFRRWAGFPYNPMQSSWKALPFRVACWALTIAVVTCCWVMFRAENMTGAANMYRSMFGLAHGFNLPHCATLYLSPTLSGYFTRLGFRFEGGLPPERLTELQVVAVFAFLLFCAVAPNTVEVMRYFADGRPRGVDWGAANSVVTGVRGVIWRPGWGFAAVLGLMFALAFASLIDSMAKSVFIYCQF
jgi:hypothetical protein